MLAPHNAENVDTFLRTISPWADAYGAATLSFVAAKRADCLEVVHAHLVLPNGPIARTDLRFETTSLLAGRFRLDTANLTVEQAVRDFADAGLETPFGRLKLLLDTGDTPSTFLQLWKAGLRDGEARMIALALSGSARPLGQDEQPYFAEVRSCVTPFASLDEMAIAVNDIPLRRDISLVEITAANCVQVDFARRVTGTTANPALVLSPNLDESKASLGLAIFNRGAEPKRLQYSGDQLQWQVDERGFDIGTVNIDVPEGSTIRCFAGYDGAPQCIG